MKLEEIRGQFKHNEAEALKARKHQLLADLESFAVGDQALSGLALFVISAAPSDAELDRFEEHLPDDVRAKLARARRVRSGVEPDCKCDKYWFPTESACCAVDCRRAAPPDHLPESQ